MVVLYFELTSFFIYCLFLKYSHLKHRKSIAKWSFFILLALIIFVRTFKYSTGIGLDLDEASGGYNAWCMANYHGVDEWLIKNPVYLKAWGSGMNILYPLMNVPFIKLFGLSLIVYRLPMLIINIVSIYIFFYMLLSTMKKSEDIFIIMTVVFLSPVMIQYSRWAVESNLFPPLMVTFISFLVLFDQNIKYKKIKYAWIDWVCFNFVIVLSAYAYSGMWIFLAIFMSFTYINIWIQLKGKSLPFIFSSLLFLIIFLFPLILFLYVNYISHHQIVLWHKITITKLATNRSSSSLVIGDHINLPLALKQNIKNIFYVLVTGYDGMPKNALPFIGAFYPLMLTFAPIGFIYSLFHKTSFNIVIL